MTISTKPLIKAAAAGAQGAVQLTSSSADVNTSGSVGVVPPALHVAQAISAAPIARAFFNVLPLTATTALTIAQLDSMVQLNGSSAMTVTLPPTSSSIPAPAGSAFWFYNQGTVAVTIAVSGSDTISAITTANKTSLVIPVGGSACFVSRGFVSTKTEWDVFDGTVLNPTSVSSVSGQSGAVVVQATDNAASGQSLIVDSGATTGNIKLARIVGSGVTISADGSGNMQMTTSFPVITPVTTTTNIGSGFSGLNTILVTSAATANVSVGITTTAASGSSVGAQLTFMNASTHTLTITNLAGAATLVYNGTNYGTSGLAIAAGHAASFVCIGSSTFVGSSGA